MFKSFALAAIIAVASANEAENWGGYQGGYNQVSRPAAYGGHHGVNRHSQAYNKPAYNTSHSSSAHQHGKFGWHDHSDGKDHGHTHDKEGNVIDGKDSEVYSYSYGNKDLADRLGNRYGDNLKTLGNRFGDRSGYRGLGYYQ